jgi:hypothetical protein
MSVPVRAARRVAGSWFGVIRNTIDGNVAGT